MIKILSTIFFLIILTYNNFSQTFGWAKIFEGNNNQDPLGASVTSDGYGNVYTTGYFEGTVDFDPGPGIFNLTSNGERDVFISKLDRNGNFVWAKSFGGISGNQSLAHSDIGYSIVVDNSGNIYVCGAFENTVDFDPGPGIYNLSSSGSDDIFILKLDTNGNFVWVKTIGGIGGDIARSITIDNGNLYTTGYFWGTVDFDPGAGVYDLGGGREGAYILKLDKDGNFIWAKCIISYLYSDYVYGESISTDNNGNVLTTGYYHGGTIDFDPGIGVLNLRSTGFSNVFILKLDSDGNFVWAKRIGGWDAVAHSITIDINDNVYTTGTFERTVDFDPGPGIFNLTSNGSLDIFISKLDVNGDFVWARNMGGKDWDIGLSVGIDKYANVYSTGLYSEEVDFDPGIGVFNLTSKGSDVVFISKLDVNGDFVWAKSFKNLNGHGCLSIGNSIHIDRSQNIYITGGSDYKQSIEFGPDTFYLTSNDFNTFVLKLSQCPTTTATVEIDTCESYEWIDGNIYTESTDTVLYIIENVSGCDSIVRLELTIHHSDNDTLTVTECDSYMWRDNIYIESGTYQYQSTNRYGCDSTILLELTIHKSEDTTLQEKVCESYNFHGDTLYTSGIYIYDTVTQYGCDSTVILDIEINKSSKSIEEKTVCESYYWHDSVYRVSGEYYYDTLNKEGCDSIVILQLEIEEKITNQDTIRICQGDTIEVLGELVWEESLVSETFTSAKGCDSIQKMQVIVDPLPQGTKIRNICAGDSIYIIDRWLKEAGIYRIKKSNTQGCDSIYEVTINERPEYITYDTIYICEGDTIEIFGFEISEEKDLEQSYVGVNECDSTVKVHVGLLPQKESNIQIELCAGDSIFIVGEWINQSGTYQENLKGANGCDSTVHIMLSVLENPGPPTYEIDCEQGQIEVHTSAGPEWQIEWDNGDTTFQTIYKSQRTSRLLLSSAQGCIEEYTIEFPELPTWSEIDIPGDTILESGGVLNIDLGLSSESWEVEWSPRTAVSCDTCFQTSIKSEYDQNIELTLRHKSGCEYRRSFTITIIQVELYIADIFTPNGDGVNDIWCLEVPKGIEIMMCKIYDRWGEVVYSGRGKTFSWDGSYRGQKAMEGVYVYVVKYRNNQGETKIASGDLTLLR